MWSFNTVGAATCCAVLDDLSGHNRHQARQLIEVTGVALRFLPPYSPDRIRIEWIFAKIKPRLRSLPVACATCRVKRCGGCWIK
ncbi:MAG: hypothetical protein CMJ49_12275 [Planctomycetaceae bacterium]|nr:hypothetical protein [Planctomycetaceae bacterium]